MKRRWFAPLVITLSALAGGVVPIAACTGGDAGFAGGGGFTESGTPGSSASGFGGGAGGGQLSDASVDVVLNNDDPPPFTGKSYCDLCGGGADCSGLSCDPTSGDCDDGGASMNGMGCKLVPNAADGGDADGGTSAQCAPAGPTEDTKLCMTSADCGGGSGCVDVSGTPQCLPYCCQSPEACKSGTWCVPEHLVDGSDAGELPKVPVCIQASNCSLLDGPIGCPPDLTCTIVRGDGTTACVQPGTGTAGEGCPCAEDYVCSLLVDKCFKLCHIGSDTDCPDGAKCVGGMAGYPDGIGNCLGDMYN